MIGVIQTVTALLVAWPSLAEPNCNNNSPAFKLLSETAKAALDPCSYKSPQQPSADEFKNWAIGFKDVKFTKEFVSADKITSNSVEYDLQDTVLKPGEALYLDVPAPLKLRPLSFIILGHRQDPQQNTSKGNSSYDETPGLTSVQLFDSTSGEWRYWGGPASGPQGAKFAEVDYSPEMENLYDWTKYGHRSLSGSESREPLYPRAIRIVSTGKDPVTISSLNLKTQPVAHTSEQNLIFSPGTQFKDSSSGTSAQLGGGQKFKGLFPQAIQLGGYSPGELPEGMLWENGGIKIAIPKGKTLVGIEVAVGDSHPDQIKNKDGGWGTKGWARLSAGLRTSKGTDWFMSYENVPPEGVLVAAPKDVCTPASESDYLILRSSDDISYLMGMRLLFK